MTTNMGNIEDNNTKINNMENKEVVILEAIIMAIKDSPEYMKKLMEILERDVKWERMLEERYHMQNRKSPSQSVKQQ